MQYKFFELIPTGTNIDFVGKSKWFFGASVIFITVSLVSIFAKGFNYGVDFKGGTQVHVKFKKATSANDLRKALDAVNLAESMVQGFGEDNQQEYLIRVLPQDLKLEGMRVDFQKALDSLSPSPGVPARLRFSEERLYVAYENPVSHEAIESGLKPSLPQGLLIEAVEPFGQKDNHEYVIRFAGAAAKIQQALSSAFGAESFETLQIEQVGAKVGDKLRAQAVGAILISILLILIYVWARFDLEFAPGAVIALVHDALVILGIFSLFDLQFDLSIVAAVLTIVGFSINDTIVIYDRIRENKGKTKTFDIARLINESLNETLGRTILTSFTLLLAALSLLFVGGPITYNFSLAFVVGVISGSYSTLYVATPITIYFYNYLQKRKARV